MTTIVRKELTEAESYKILDQYAQGLPVTEIAKGVSRDSKIISSFIQKKLREMNAIRETNDITSSSCTKDLKRQQGATPSKFITSSFLSEVEDKALIYAYYFSQTGDNKFSLKTSGLDIGIPKSMRKNTKDYVYRIRGQYLRDIPAVSSYIQEQQDQRIREYRLEKPQIQMELVNQIEELKELAKDDPKHRTTLLKSIEMLGRTIGSFTDRVEVDETNAKSGLEILMEKVKGEVSTYEPKE